MRETGRWPGRTVMEATVAQQGTAWLRSSYCEMTTCVEVRPESGRVLVRDGKRVVGPVLAFPTRGWRAFCAALRDGSLAG